MAGAARFFIVKFDGSRIAAHLEDVDAAFVLGHGTIKRSGSGDRRYVRTIEVGYLSTDWTYEITFTSPPNADDEILFIGFGEAVPDPFFFDEPRNSVTFRIHQGRTGTEGLWRVDVAAHDVGIFSWTYIEDLGTLGGPEGGTRTARIRKIGPAVTFEILGTSLATVIPDITAAAPFLTTVPVRVFFGSAAAGYSFDDFRLLPERLAASSR